MEAELEDKLDKLRTKAGGLLNSLRGLSSPSQMPCYVEFAGTPKSGKSTCIDIVSHFFRRLGYKVHAPTEGASKRTPYYLKDDLVAYNAWCASYALSHILEGVYGSDKFDLAILDRGLFDSLAWFELLSVQRKITPNDQDVIAAFLMLPQWRQHIDQVFLFKADHQTALKREYQNKLIEEPGTAMNDAFLLSLNTAYEKVQDKYGSLIPSICVIDTSDSNQTTPKSTAVEVANSIITLLENKVAKYGS